MTETELEALMQQMAAESAKSGGITTAVHNGCVVICVPDEAVNKKIDAAPDVILDEGDYSVTDITPEQEALPGGKN